jgi:hypothetical protein
MDVWEFIDMYETFSVAHVLATVYLVVEVPITHYHGPFLFITSVFSKETNSVFE